MEYVTYCLMCLGTKVKMYPMNSMMIRIYNELIPTTHKNNINQMRACYECAYLLKKFEKFKTKCHKAYNILSSFSAEPFEVTEESVNSIDRKQNKLGTNLTSCTFTYDYQPKQQESDEHFNIDKVKPDPITVDNKLTTDSDDPLQLLEMQERQLGINNTPENVIENDYQLLDIKIMPEYIDEDNYQPLDINNTPEHDIEDDYQFIHTFQVESSNYNSNTGSMLWLSIQSKDNIDVGTNKPHSGTPVQINEDYFDAVDNCDILDNYLVEEKLEIQIEPITKVDTKNETNKRRELRMVNNVDGKRIMKKFSKKTQNNSYDVSDSNVSGSVLSLDSKILNDHMTVTELTPEDAWSEFVLRKKSSNYTRNPYKCDLCYRGFISKTSFESHLKKHSSKNGAFQCDICKLCFIDKSYLNNHRIRMHRRKFSCKMCPYVCFAQTQCNAHILSHRGKVYTCKACGMTYRFLNSLLTHTRLKHSVECVCDFCGSTFASANGLYSHKHIVHRQENNERLGPQCIECDVHFASELAWKRHRVLCSRHEVQFGCKVCGEIYQDGDSLKIHAREHGTIDYWTRKNYLVKTCIFCKIGLPNKTALKNHLATEHPTEVTDDLFKTRTETYVCEFCGTAFPKRYSLILHQRKHSDEMPYSCSDCGMRTKYKDYLTMHRRTQHSNEFTDKFQCDLCGRPFSDKSRLVRHIKGHMGIRPFKCVACDKTFMFRCDERTHYKHVHDKEPYPKKGKDKNKKSRKKAPRAKIKIFNNI